MSDLRNFNKSFDNDSFGSAPLTVSEPIRDANQTTFRDTGGLSSFHHIEEEDGETSNTSRIAGALIVALMIGTAGVYAYSNYSSSPKLPVADNNLPSPSAPKQVAAAAAPSSVQTAPTPANNSAMQNSPYSAAPSAPAASAPQLDNTATPASTESKPVKPVRSHIARKDDAEQNGSEAAQTAQLNREADQATQNGSVAVPLSAAPSVASATPLPEGPAAPSSAVASNGQSHLTQSAPAEDIAPTPSVTPAQPALTTVAPTAPTQTPAQDSQAPTQPQ